MEENKIYYSIGAFSKKTGVKEYVLRYWESVFPQLKPYKSQRGHRRYTDEHITIVNYIKELMWEKKYTIKGAKKALNEYLSKPKFTEVHFSSTDSKKILKEIKSVLTEIINLLQEENR